MIQHFGIEEFRTRRFPYKSGEHVAFFGPTQEAGKTTLAYALLEVAASEERRAVTLCMKHVDRVVAAWTRRLNFIETPTWPPKIKLTNRKPPGYTLWPRQSLTDEEADNKLLEREFRKAITYNRGHRPSITHANELYGLLAELNLRTKLTAVITRDSIAGHGLWYETQKPSGTQGVSVPGFFFNSASWMFLSYDGDERNRSRYSEIACGIPASSIEREVLALQHEPFTWLCIHRGNPPTWCVVHAYDPALAV